jgi:hypothetical protein
MVLHTTKDKLLQAQNTFVILYKVSCISAPAFVLLLAMIVTAMTFSFIANLALAITTDNNSTDSTNISSITNTSIILVNSNIPNAKSVFDTGTMSLPSSVSGFIIYIPDEAHHPITDKKTMSPKNANYVPTNLIIPSGTSIAFIHGDPNHIHVEIIKDKTGKVAWKTTPISHPGGSDVKVLSAGSYTVSDQKYAPMKGTITVEGNVQSKGNNLVAGGIFVPTDSVSKYKSDFAAAGFKVLSEYNFISKVVQKDIAGPTTFLIYSTNKMKIQDAIPKLEPLIKSLPYK